MGGCLPRSTDANNIELQALHNPAVNVNPNDHHNDNDQNRIGPIKKNMDFCQET